jgi:hypothetical protein
MIGFLLHYHFPLSPCLLLFVIRVSSVFDPWLFLISWRPKAGLGVLVEPDGLEDADQLETWIQRAWKFVRTLPAK